MFVRVERTEQKGGGCGLSLERDPLWGWTSAMIDEGSEGSGGEVVV